MLWKILLYFITEKSHFLSKDYFMEKVKVGWLHVFFFIHRLFFIRCFFMLFGLIVFALMVRIAYQEELYINACDDPFCHFNYTIQIIIEVM